MDTSTATSCLQDLRFGPGSACRPLDFTRTFEASILSILPDAVALAIALVSFACLALRGAIGFSTTATVEPRSSRGGRGRTAWRTACFDLRHLERRSQWHLALKVVLALLVCLASLLRIVGQQLDSSRGPTPFIWEHASIERAAVALQLVASAAALLPLTLLCHVLLPGPSTRLVSYVLVKAVFTAAILRTMVLVGVDASQRLAFVSQAILLAAYTAILVLENTKKTKLASVSADGGDATKSSASPNPEQARGLLSKSMMAWHLPLLWLGNRARIAYRHLYAIPPSTAAASTLPRLDAALRSRNTSRRVHSDLGLGLVAASFGAFWPFWIAPILPRLVMLAGQMMQPLVFSALINFTDESRSGTAEGGTTPSSATGWALVGSVFIVYGTITLANAVYWEHVYKSTLNYRSALISTLYAKQVRLAVELPDDRGEKKGAHSLVAEKESGDSPAAPTDASTLIAVDVEKIVTALEIVHELWASVVSIGVAAYLLYTRIDLAFLACFAAILLFMAVSALVARQMPGRQGAWLGRVQARVGVCRTMLQHFAPIRFNRLAGYFSNRLLALRDQELSAMSSFYGLLCWIAAFANMATNLTALLGFTAAWALARGSTPRLTLDAATVFSALSVMQILEAPINTIGQNLGVVFSALGSLARIEAFLYLPECDGEGVDSPRESRSDVGSYSTTEASDTSFKMSKRQLPDTELEFGIPSPEDQAIKFKTDASCSSHSEADSNRAMHDVLGLCGLTAGDSGLDVPHLLVVVGSTGSGKTTLLRRLVERLGQRGVQTGYASQQAWIQSASLRDNIVFYDHYDADRFSKVLETCALTAEVRSLADGEATVLGPGTLSGGQQHRVAIARALYSRSSIVVLDDSLAALDPHTARHLRSRLVEGKDPLFAGRTVIWATSLLSDPDPNQDTVLVEDFDIKLRGTMHDVARMSPGLFSDSPAQAESEDKKSGSISRLGVAQKEIQNEDNATEAANPEQKPSATPASGCDEPSDRKLDDEDEQEEEPSASSAIYRFYFSGISKPRIAVAVVCGICGMGSTFVCQVILERWTHHLGGQAGFYLGMLALATGAGLVGLLVCLLIFFKLIVTDAGRRYHSAALGGLLAAPSWTVSEAGEANLVTRLAQDAFVADSEFPLALFNTGANLITLVGAMILIFVSAPYLAASTPVLFVLYWLLQRLYLRNSRQLRSMDLAAKATLVGVLESTRRGLEVMRALRRTSALEADCQAKLDRAQKPLYARFATLRFLRTALYAMTWCVATALAIVVVSMRRSSSAGLLGIALTNVTTLAATLNSALQSWVMLETAAIAVNRVHRLTLLESEDESEDKDSKTDGGDEKSSHSATPVGLELSGVSMSYGASGPAVLHDVSLSVKAGGKIALCGRSGSGKSSVLTALVGGVSRDLITGRITLGGEAVADMSNNDVRRHLWLVNQHPVAWSAAIRDVLLPRPLAESEGNEAAVWAALADVGLADLVRNSPRRLDSILSQSGEAEAADADAIRLSAGQTQLLCMARAILYRHQFGLLLLDEATASLDTDAEARLIEVVRTHFKAHTVVAVAHRLATVRDFDTVVVMDKGEVVEVVDPRIALNCGDSGVAGSRFRDMARQQGLSLPSL